MLVEISEQNSFLVVRSTKDFVIVQIELVTHTKPDKDKIAQWLTLHWPGIVHVKLRVRVHSPVSALLAGKALKVVDIGPGSHNHLEGGDHFVARRAVACGAEQPGDITWHELSDDKMFARPPEIVPLAEEEVPLGVQTMSHLAQPGVAAAALEAVLVPEHV